MLLLVGNLALSNPHGPMCVCSALYHIRVQSEVIVEGTVNDDAYNDMRMRKNGGNVN